MRTSITTVRVPEHLLRLGDYNDLDHLLQVKSRKIESRPEGIRLLCELQSLVNKAHGSEYPADCICGASNIGRFENKGDAIRFIVTATLEKLKRDGGMAVDKRPENTIPCYRNTHIEVKP